MVESSPKIWVVDPTGATPVRAVALGRDAQRYNTLLMQHYYDSNTSVSDGTPSPSSNDNHNKNSTHGSHSPCSWKTGQDGLKSLLWILLQLFSGDHESHGSVRVELAIVVGNTSRDKNNNRNNKNRFLRVRVQDLATASRNDS